jgi:hypothetical protein
MINLCFICLLQIPGTSESTNNNFAPTADFSYQGSYDGSHCGNSGNVCSLLMFNYFTTCAMSKHGHCNGPVIWVAEIEVRKL